MKKILFILGICSMVVLTALLIWFAVKPKTENVRFVSMTQLYLESRYYKKFQKDLEDLEKTSNDQLATMQKDLRTFKASGSSQQFIDELEAELLQKRDALTAEYQKKKDAFEKIIWEQLNAGIAEYGKHHQIDFILGAKGDGNIMFASDRCDITKELIQYINQKK